MRGRVAVVAIQSRESGGPGTGVPGGPFSFAFFVSFSELVHVNLSVSHCLPFLSLRRLHGVQRVVTIHVHLLA